jgi:hypothetical protein
MANNKNSQDNYPYLLLSLWFKSTTTIGQPEDHIVLPALSAYVFFSVTASYNKHFNY